MTATQQGTNPFASLEWRNIGPHRGGRVVAVAGHPTERGTFYFGGCAGGVWKTTNGGSHWENITDPFFKTAAVGALVVSESDPSTIYAGTGETSIRSNVSHGDGVYKSTDGGRTWRNVGLADTRHIGRIVLHPRNPDIVWVAALGHAWGTNEERGVFKSTDGGKTWRKVLYKGDRVGAIDLTMDPNTPDILYAALWETQRYPWALDSGGPGSGIWMSEDGGETWTDIGRNKGLPKGEYGKIGITASPARAGRVWATIEAAGEDGKDGGGVFRSDDYGATWQLLNGDAELRGRPWYYQHIHADPAHPDTVWINNLAFWKSTDGGKTYENVPTPHGDNHALWIDPRDPQRLIQGNDGGANVSFDGGRTWSSILNQPTAQFYHVTTDDRQPYHVYGPQQDNWAMRLPSIGFEGAISWKDYVEPGGGESGYIAISKKPPYKVFGGGIGTGLGHGRLLCWNPETRQTRNVTVWPEVHGFGAGAQELKYRFQWTFPLEFSPHDDDVLYACSNFVHRSTDEGHSWEVISPDLTRNDPAKLVSNGRITSDNSGAEIYCTIFAFQESPHEKGVFWAGSDDGLLHISKDGGGSWQNITPPDLPEWTRITIIELSPFDKATAYLAATKYQLDDTTPYLFKTTDYGQTWTRITNGIPADDFTRVIRCDPNRQGLLYAGTETGIYVSFDDGANWRRFETNLPVVPIWDLVVKGTDLVAATHGRSFWILDDITPLHQMADAAQNGEAQLFRPRDTIRWRLYGRAYGAKTAGYTSYKMTGPVTVAYRAQETPQGTTVEKFLDAGSNPPNGVIIHYTLPEGTQGEVTLRILDAAGNEVRKFTGKADAQPDGAVEDATPTSGEAPGAGKGESPEAPAQAPEPKQDEEKGQDGPTVPVAAGAHRFVWDLRYERPTPLEEAGKTTRRLAMMDEGIPPKAAPGEYTVELTVNGTTQRQTFRLLKDPRVAASEEELRSQFELKLAIRDRVSELNEGINKLRRMRAQIEATEERAKAGGGNEELAAAAKALKEELKAIEGSLMLVEADKPRPGPSKVKEKFAALAGMIDESDDAPTVNAHAVFTLLSEQTEEQLAKLHHIVTEDAVGFNNLVKRAEIPAISV
jgi:photosystem II stability/assembly factor-like uncharacterized protein